MTYLEVFIFKYLGVVFKYLMVLLSNVIALWSGNKLYDSNLLNLLRLLLWPRISIIIKRWFCCWWWLDFCFCFFFLINVYNIKLVNSVIQVFYKLANSLSIGWSIIERGMSKSSTIIVCLPNSACSQLYFIWFETIIRHLDL